MLDLAFCYISDIQSVYQKTLLDDRYKFYMYGIKQYHIFIEPNDSYKLQYVSIDQQNNLLGLFECKLNRETQTAYDVTAIKFISGYSSEFSADMYRFIVNILFLRYGVDRIVFNVIKGNKAEVLYDKLITRYGGRIVGTFRNEIKLYDGKLYDVKYYEVTKDECLPLVLQVDAYNYRFCLEVNIGG